MYVPDPAWVGEKARERRSQSPRAYAPPGGTHPLGCPRLARCPALGEAHACRVKKEDVHSVINRVGTWKDGRLGGTLYRW